MDYEWRPLVVVHKPEMVKESSEGTIRGCFKEVTERILRGGGWFCRRHQFMIARKSQLYRC